MTLVKLFGRTNKEQYIRMFGEPFHEKLNEKFTLNFWNAVYSKYVIIILLRIKSISKKAKKQNKNNSVRKNKYKLN